jgi:hypothetical protein
LFDGLLLCEVFGGGDFEEFEISFACSFAKRIVTPASAAKVPPGAGPQQVSASQMQIFCALPLPIKKVARKIAA